MSQPVEISRPVARVLVLDPSDHLLLLFDDRDEERGGFWYPPGGLIEKGETPEQAAGANCSRRSGSTPNSDPWFTDVALVSFTGVVATTRTSGTFSCAPSERTPWSVVNATTKRPRSRPIAGGRLLISQRRRSRSTPRG